MPRVIVELLEGRTEEQIRNAAKAITDDVVKYLAAKDPVMIVFREVRDTRLFRAGKPAKEWR